MVPGESDGECVCEEGYELEEGKCLRVLYRQSNSDRALISSLLIGNIVQFILLMTVAATRWMKRLNPLKETARTPIDLTADEEASASTPTKSGKNHSKNSAGESSLLEYTTLGSEEDLDSEPQRIFDVPVREQAFEMLDWNEGEAGAEVLIGRGGFASVYRVVREGRVYALKRIDVKLDSFQTVKKLGIFFKRLFQELLVIQKIKLTGSKRLLKYYGFSLKINRFLCLEVNLLSDLM